MTNREVFANLLMEYGLTQAKAAELICAHADRACSVRAVRSWLNDPQKPSSRPCPDWALIALRKAVS